MVRIVAVDDDQDHLEIIMKNLSEMGHYPKGFKDGSEVWKYMQANPDKVDVVILDKMMPKMDGLEVVEKVQAHPVLKDVVVIMQTADTRIGKGGEALEKGIHFYLTKPFEPMQMKGILKAAIRILKNKTAKVEANHH